MKPTLMLLFLIALALGGCAIISKDRPRVDVELKNESGDELSDVSVWFGGTSYKAGILPVGVFKDYMYYPAPITETARVEWTDMAGRRQTRQVDLSQVYTPGQSGLLQIAITESGGVEARMLPLPTLSRK